MSTQTTVVTDFVSRQHFLVAFVSARHISSSGMELHPRITDDKIAKKVKQLAEQERRTIPAMVTALIEEALRAREQLVIAAKIR